MSHASNAIRKAVRRSSKRKKRKTPIDLSAIPANGILKAKKTSS